MSLFTYLLMGVPIHQLMDVPIHSVVTWADRRHDPMGRWLRQLKARRGTNRTVVALANKMARIAWVVLAKDEAFDLNKAFA